ncbi:MAG: hypothetical protein ACR2H5_10285, partial [Ktedonobacteraceae bacterium]
AQPFPAGRGSQSRVVYSRGDPGGRPGGELNRLSTLKLTPKSDAPCGHQVLRLATRLPDGYQVLRLATRLPNKP